MPSLQEHVDLVRGNADRVVGTYLETKHPTVVGICMVLEQSLVEVCLKGLNGVSMCPVVWEWCMNACEKSVRGLWG